VRGCRCFNPDLVVVVEKISKGTGASPVADKILIFPDHEGFDLDFGGFHVFVVDAVGSRQGIGHGHHLTFIGGIGKDS